ncbi:hypothetical protein ACHAXT_000003 [Thalassiosira profunda]
MTFLLHTILHYLRLCWNFLSSFFGASSRHHGGRGGGIQLPSFFFGRSAAKTLTFDNGMQVEIGQKIAEGGFSYVFEAFPLNDNSRDPRRASAATVDTEDTAASTGGVKYALKRINCADHEIVRACRHEAGVHRSLPSHHPNLLELLGLKFDNDVSSTPPSNASMASGSEHSEYNACYMLFPYIPRSLRGEITQRNILCDDPRDGRRPFSTREVLQLFSGLVDALTAMHDANLSHRDVKLENVLLQSRGYGDATAAASSSLTPVLMDFGSAGPLTAQLNSRPQVLTAIETAAQHTTMPYRPPELFEGGMRQGPREVLDYGKVDVWSLGCVLFGLMHGASPFEMEFARGEGGGPGRQQQQPQQFGLVRIMECTHLKILGEVPMPPWASDGADDSTNSARKDGRYPLALYKLVRYMVQHDRAARPSIHEVARRFGEFYRDLLGERWAPFGEGRRAGGEGNSYDDFDSLIAGRDFV